MIPKSKWLDMSSRDIAKHYMDSGVLSAWLEGAELEAREDEDDEWEEISAEYGPFDFPDCQFRVKPEAPIESPKIDWVDIKKRVPDTSKRVLIYYPAQELGEVRTATWNPDRKYFYGCPGVTHWAPFPNTPGDQA